MRSSRDSHHPRLVRCAAATLPIVVTLTLAATAAAQVSGGTATTVNPCQGRNIVTADIVALDQNLVWNKFGSRDPEGMMYALEADIVDQPGSTGHRAGMVHLRSNLRPRPLVLRVNEGDCLRVNFKNLLDPNWFSRDTPRTRTASFHVVGMSIADVQSHGGNIGQSPPSLVAPNGTMTYTFVAEEEGTHLAHSLGAVAGGEGDGGSLAHGLFGAVNVEPTGSRWLHNVTGQPILNGNTITSSTPNAIIYGFPTPVYVRQPPEFMSQGDFREFTVIFHDEAHTLHANPRLNPGSPDLPVLHSVRDAFGINYGISGIGQIVLDALCAPDCRYEESFLTSWANGDPALLPQYPDDPSNVWHSYMGDRVKIRNVHAGPAETHVFHLHAHQWVYTPKDENSTYLDSQAVGPAAAFDYDIAYGGSGNRNYTVGDAIFHCHLYPHFAQGMWGLWRVHDVYEDGRRPLPDNTPTPRVAPMPGKALPPLPTNAEPGYPFFIPGAPGNWPVAGFPGSFQTGHRPPQPPLDMAETAPGSGVYKDGGLPRHLILRGATVPVPPGPLANFRQQYVANSMPVFAVVPPGGPMPPFGANNYIVLPQGGTDLEQRAMRFHADTTWPSGTWGGKASILWPSATTDPVATDYTSGVYPAGRFGVNGRDPAPGAPYANPCPPTANKRYYAASAINYDLTVWRDGNGSGAFWHDPHATIAVLDQDIPSNPSGTAEPLFFRANSNDCITFQHTNRTEDHVDDDFFQVITPVDTIGQHIHLVKFDVTSSDGSGNGWNYEDGTFAKGEILDRLNGMGFAGNAHPNSSGTLGFQSTMQLWWADPLLNGAGFDRTIRTVFTHDHFGPSTIQQHGYYAALVIEPADSTWWNSETGQQLGGRSDGGPTSWRADIHDNNNRLYIREFCMAVADFAIVVDEQNNPINPPDVREAISADDPGTFVMNYRTEPIPTRIGVIPANGSANTNQLRLGNPGRLPYVFDSKTHGDPFTPLLTAFQGDTVEIRMITGAQEESHAFKINRAKWLRETFVPESGLVNGQHEEISEHYEKRLKAQALEPFGLTRDAPLVADSLWSDTSEDALWNGVWGFLRVFRSPSVLSATSANPALNARLQPLPDNPGIAPTNPAAFNWPCPANAPIRTYDVTAFRAVDVIDPDGITYLRAPDPKIYDPTGILFVRNQDLVMGRLPVNKQEPLVLRANAGDCLKINLTNRIAGVLDNRDDAKMPNIVAMSIDALRPDEVIGWSPDLIYTDSNQGGDSSNIGYNRDLLVPPGATQQFTAYCGDIKYNPVTRTMDATPIAFGVCGVRSMGDVIKQAAQGLVAAIVVEPEGSFWFNPTTSPLPSPVATTESMRYPTGTSAIVRTPDGKWFREFVVVQQDGLNLRRQGNVAIPDYAPTGEEADAEDAGEKAYNYKSVPFWAKLNPMGGPVASDVMNTLDMTNVHVGANPGVPIFNAKVGDPVVFRLTEPAGRQRAHSFVVAGHHWRDEWENPRSPLIGARQQHTIGSNWNLWLHDPAGGAGGVARDYLLHEMGGFQWSQGLWAIMRVQ